MTNVIRCGESLPWMLLHHHVDPVLASWNLAQGRGIDNTWTQRRDSCAWHQPCKLKGELTAVRLNGSLRCGDGAVHRHRLRGAFRRGGEDARGVADQPGGLKVVRPVVEGVRLHVRGHIHLLAGDQRRLAVGEEGLQAAECERVNDDPELRGEASRAGSSEFLR